MSKTQETVYLLHIPKLIRHLAQENPNQVTWLPVRFLRLRTSVYFLVHFPYRMNLPAWFGQKIELGPTASDSSRHNPATFDEMTRITRNTLVIHGSVGTTVTTVTHPSFARDFCHGDRFVATPQCRKLTYAVWVSDEQKCKLLNHKLTVFSTLCRSVYVL